jgi:hypothetical protein
MDLCSEEISEDGDEAVSICLSEDLARAVTSRMRDCMRGRAMVGVALMKTPRDNPRGCEMSGSSRIAAAGWLSQAG